MSSRNTACAEAGRFEISFEHSPPTVYPEETHATVQVCVPLERARYGVVRRSETGRILVHELGARDVLVVPAGQPHAVTWRSAADIVSLHFAEDFVCEAVDSPRLRLSDTFTVRDPFITGAAAQLRTEMRTEGRVAPAFGEALAIAIAYRIGIGSRNNRFPITERTRPLTSRDLVRLELFIDEHLDGPITLSQLAALLGVSKWHFMRRFSASRGMSPHDFIVGRRLRRAQSLLATAELSITEVALEVGMTHSHFSRSFLRRFGVSPREYRRNRRH